jgi:uncharacterized protein YyaL (SSP411 family)
MRSLLAHPLLNPTGLGEILHERRGGHPANPAHAPHLAEALEWLARAQDATPDDGFARGYSILYNSYFGSRGWQPSYPETTGYIIPTLLEAARRLDRPDLSARAVRAARWEIEIQLADGAVQGGVIGEGRSPAVFNTGQVMLGWLAAHESTGSSEFAEAALKAGRYLQSVQSPDGHWRKGNSQFARGDTTLYNARVAWAMAEAGVRLDRPEFQAAASANLTAVAALQHENGWFPNCCLTDPERPLLHTIAYTVRGLLEGGRVLGDDRLLAAATRTAARLKTVVREDGWMPGRYGADWSPAVRWSCLTGEAQMANNWMRLAVITGDRSWLEPVPRVLHFLKTTQNRSSADLGLRGGIKGAAPMSGDYGRYEILNWATKYFADALMRDDGSVAAAAGDAFRLA